MTLKQLIREAEEELRDWALDNPHMLKIGDDDDQIHQIADSLVPVYAHDLLSLLNNDASLAYETSEYGYGTAGDTMVGKAQAIIYEKLVVALHREWWKLEGAYRDYDDYLYECEDEDTEPVTFREWYEEGNY